MSLRSLVPTFIATCCMVILAPALTAAAQADIYEPNDTAAQASVLLGPGETTATQTHSIYPVGDVDWVSIEIPEDITAANLIVETSAPPPTVDDTIITLYDAQLTAIETNDDGGPSLFSRIDRECDVDALPSGVYYVRVTETNGSLTIDSYAIEATVTPCEVEDPAEPGNTPEDAALLWEPGSPSNVSETYSIAPAGDVDWLRFTLDAASAVNVTAGPGATLGLYDDSIMQLAFNDGQGGSALIERTCAAPLQPGDYFLEVAASIPEAIVPSYTLSITVSPCTGDPTEPGLLLSVASLSLTEGGPPQSYTVALTAAPTAPVQVAISGEGLAVSADDTTYVNRLVLNFTPADWQTPQSVWAQAVEDTTAQGNRTTQLTHIANGTPAYIGLSAEITVTIADDDSAGLIVTESSDSTAMTEGESDTINVTLTTAPTSPVTVSAAIPADDVSLSATALTFTGANWDIPQTLTLTALEDDLSEGTEVLTLTLSASGPPAYEGLAETVTVEVSDAPPPDNGSGENLLSNAGFEAQLSATDDWVLVTTGENGDQRYQPPPAYQNEAAFVMLFVNNGALDAALQTIDGLNGAPGDVITLSFDYGYLNLSADGFIGARFILRSEGGTQQIVNCIVTDRSEPVQLWQPLTCEGLAVIDYTSIVVVLGGYEVTGGLLAFDRVSLTVEPAP